MNELSRWALSELAPWRLNPPSRADCHAAWTTLNETDPTVFLFQIANRTVTVAAKPETPAIKDGAILRMQAYHRFLHAAAERLDARYSATLALCVADRFRAAPAVPVFCFQKTQGSRIVLLPDLDFLTSNFHAGEGFQDTRAYAEKSHTAVFAGATTGGMITPEIARNCSLPRLRAARFFHGHQRVNFLLPAIVQCTTPEAARLLREMPFCRPGRIDWKAQFNSRFLISMDGNGATCARVAIVLRSNSVLLKYASDEVLYYFHGLQPWRHYVPVDRDESVDRILDLDAWRPGLLESIAQAGADFARTFLTREAATAYTAELLNLYQDCFST